MRDNRQVVTSAVAAPRSVARSGLPILGSLVVGGCALSVLFAATGIGVPCPFLALTGWQCPLCGGTRMGAALLHGDLAAAYALNPLALIVLTALGVLGAVWAVEVIGGRAVRLPRGMADRLRRVPALAWVGIAMLFAVVDTLVRNLG